MDIQGAIRGKPHKTTIPDKTLPCPLGPREPPVPRACAHHALGRDLMYVATWKGFVPVAFVVDACVRRIAGCRVGTRPHAGFVAGSVLGALEQAIHQRRPVKAEVIHRRGPWRGSKAAEQTTLDWLDWLDNRRPPEPPGNIPPAKAEADYDAAPETDVRAA